MTLRNRGAPRGFSKLAAPLMASAMRRANEKDLARSAAEPVRLPLSRPIDSYMQTLNLLV